MFPTSVLYNFALRRMEKTCDRILWSHIQESVRWGVAHGILLIYTWQKSDQDDSDCISQNHFQGTLQYLITKRDTANDSIAQIHSQGVYVLQWTWARYRIVPSSQFYFQKEILKRVYQFQTKISRAQYRVQHLQRKGGKERNEMTSNRGVQHQNLALGMQTKHESAQRIWSSYDPHTKDIIRNRLSSHKRWTTELPAMD